MVKSQPGPECMPKKKLQSPGTLEHRPRETWAPTSFQEQTRGEVFQNLVFHQELLFRGAQNTQPSVCLSKRGRPSQALRVARSSLCQQGKGKQPSCLANLTKGFSDQWGLEEAVEEGAASSPCKLWRPGTFLVRIGISREFPKNSDDCASSWDVLCSCSL